MNNTDSKNITRVLTARLVPKTQSVQDDQMSLNTQNISVKYVFPPDPSYNNHPRFQTLNKQFSDGGLKLLKTFILTHVTCPTFNLCNKESPKSAQSVIKFICPTKKPRKIKRGLTLDQYMQTPTHVIRESKVPASDEVILTQGPVIVNSIVSEVVCLSLCNKLVKHQLSPHFVPTEEVYICDDRGVKKVFMTSPFVKGKSTNDLLNTKNYELVNSILFQVLSSILTLQTNFNLVHYDLHKGNIMLQEVPAESMITYTIDDTNYQVPTFGSLCKIIDFGLARINGVLERKNILTSGDYYNIPVLTQPSTTADQRRFAYTMLKLVFADANINLFMEMNAPEKLGYFYAENEDNSKFYFQDEETFKQHFQTIFSSLTNSFDLNQDYLQIVTILKDMLNGDDIRTILRHNYGSYVVKKKVKKAYNLNKRVKVSLPFK